jgi:putative membrane protein
MYLLLRWIVNALVIYGLAYFLPGIDITNYYMALLVVVVFALVNAIIGGLLKLLSLPITLLTLGLFALVINGLMFWLTAAFVPGFDIVGFWPAFVGALIYTVATALTNKLLKSK